MSRRLILALVCLLLISRVVSAQPHPMMHVSVEAERVMIGAESVPRFAKLLPNSWTIPAGQVEFLPLESTWDAIEVAGTLRVNPMALSTLLRVTHLFVLPGGRIEWTVPCGRGLEVVLRDVPIDLNPLSPTYDRFQWGNGILNFGHQTRIGCAMPETFLEAEGDIPAGATSITLTKAPVGWTVGSELIIPDTRQQAPVAEFNTAHKNSARRESPVTITAITGNILALSKPLDFEHNAIRKPSGELVLRPRVANLTRNLVIRSENPAGTPGHTANVGHEATADVRFNQFVELGRTHNAIRNSAPVSSTMSGLNQNGRYADHDHHMQGFGSQSIGNSYIGHPGVTWVKAIHSTSDYLVERNVCVDASGACFVTEDGNEVRTKLIKNFAAYVSGVYDVPGCSPFPGQSPADNIGKGCPGGEGAGFWLRGFFHGVIEGNEAWNNRFGMPLMNMPVAGWYPTTPGGPNDGMLPDVTQIKPASFTGNVFASNLSASLDNWDVPLFANEGLISAHNASTQVVMGPIPSGNMGVWLKGATILGRDAIAQCVSIGKAYASRLRIEDSYIGGCNLGLAGGGGNVSTELLGNTWQNALDLPFPTEDIPSGLLTLVNNRHLALPGRPLRAMTYGEIDFDPSVATPKLAGFSCRHSITSWNGMAGADFCLTIPQVAPPPFVAGRTNVARASAGATVTASSAYSPIFPASAVIDGDRLGAKWGSGGGWNDATEGTYPDWLEIAFGGPRVIEEVGIYTLQDLVGAPIEPTEGMTFSQYGLKDIEVQWWNGTAWQRVPNGFIDSNTQVWRRVAFSPLTTTKIRVLITSASQGFSRVIEVEALSPLGSTPPVPGPVNCVLSDPSPWIADGPTQDKRTYTIVTQPANGGTACGDTVETRPAVFVDVPAKYRETTKTLTGALPNGQPFTVVVP